MTEILEQKLLVLFLFQVLSGALQSNGAGVKKRTYLFP